MRFFMVDRITELEVDVCIKGVKNVSIVEDFFDDHTSGPPTLSPPFLIESLAQLGVWLVAAGSDFQSRAVLLSLGEVRFSRPVRPGDRLVLENRVESQSGQAAVISGRITVDDELVMEMRDCMCAVVPTGDLDDPAATRRLHAWLTAGLHPASKGRP